MRTTIIMWGKDVGYRIDHLRESKKYHADLDEKTADWLPTKGSWRSWWNHPFANTRFHFWNNVPHRPKWDFSVSSVGSVNHEYRDADVLWLSTVCGRCAMSIDEGTFYPAGWVDEILEKLKGESDG